MSSYRRAYTYAALQPYLSKPIPLIQLKYLTRPSLAEQKAMVLPSPCAFCGRTWGGVGSGAKDGSSIICERCAIRNFQLNEGFKTLTAARAYRRRLFDVGYLWLEMLLDEYIALHELNSYEDVSPEAYGRISDLATFVMNSSTTTAQKVRLHNTPDQAMIEQNLRKFITPAVERLLRQG